MVRICWWVECGVWEQTPRSSTQTIESLEYPFIKMWKTGERESWCWGMRVEIRSLILDTRRLECFLDTCVTMSNRHLDVWMWRSEERLGRDTYTWQVSAYGRHWWNQMRSPREWVYGAASCRVCSGSGDFSLTIENKSPLHLRLLPKAVWNPAWAGCSKTQSCLLWILYTVILSSSLPWVPGIPCTFFILSLKCYPS